MKEPFVSVLMTAYNREKYIAEAIESVIDSTYQNWELIIVDDCSKDKTVQIARAYEAKDQRINVYVNESNLGDYPNRNKAASYAKGKYLKYVDADDLIYPYGLEQLVHYMERFTDAGYGLCSLDQDEYRPFPFKLSPKQAYQRHYFECALFHKAPLSSIIRRDVFVQINGFSGKRMLGDFEMWHLLSQRFPVVLMPHGIVWYREHEEQEMNDHRNDPFEPFKYLLLQKEMIASDLCPLNGNERREICNKLNNRIAKSILSAFRRRGIRKGQELYENSSLSVFDLLKRGLLAKW